MMEYAWLWWTLLLLVTFVGIVAYVYRGRAKRRYQEDARIPFQEDEANKR